MSLEFTGERYLPSESGRNRIEHYHRYLCASAVAADKRVLDAACGEGYGSSLIALSAARVVGVDVDPASIAHARATYAGDNIEFIEASVTALPFAPASFDVIISFETLEHLAEQAEMLAEFRRVLTPDGVLLLSSPNRPIYSADGGAPNEYHVKELDLAELKTALAASFTRVELYGQRLQMGTLIQPLEGRGEAGSIWHDDGEDLAHGVGALAAPTYFLAVCGGADAQLPSLPVSFLYPDAVDIVSEYVNFALWARNAAAMAEERGDYIRLLQAEVERLNQALRANDGETSPGASDSGAFELGMGEYARRKEEEVVDLKFRLEQAERKNLSAAAAAAEAERSARAANDRAAALDAAKAEIAAGRDELANALQRAIEEEDRLRTSLDQAQLEAETLRTERESLAAALADKQRRLMLMRRSVSWRVTAPLRDLRDWVVAPRLQSRRCADRALGLAKRVYQALPLSPSVKARHRDRLVRSNPDLLLRSGSPQSTIATLNMPPSGGNIGRAFARAEIGADFAPAFAPLEDPGVSIIIPIDAANAGSAHRCLAAIAARRPATAFEILLVGARAAFPDELKMISGTRLIDAGGRTVSALKAAAAEARGRFLLFLDAEAEVGEGWLDELRATFDAFPGAGLVGSRLLFADGRLKAAGGVIWRGGETTFWGAGEDRFLPHFSHARDTDFCPGASVMVPADLFRQVGGFEDDAPVDEAFFLDLSLKIADRGRRVLCQPMSDVIDRREGAGPIRAAQAGRFDDYPPRAKAATSRGAPPCRGETPRRALVIDHCTPTPDQDAGSITVFNMILLLREAGFDPTFAPEDNFLYLPRYTTQLQRAGVRVLYAPYHTSIADHLDAEGEAYDLVLMFRPAPAEKYMNALRKKARSAKIVYHTVDLHFLRMSRQAAVDGDAALSAAVGAMKAREIAAIRAADATIVHSTEEARIVRDLVEGAKVHVFPLIMNTREETPPFEMRTDVAFIGGYQHTPNVDAAAWFAREVMPRLRPLLPGVKFRIVGSKAPKLLHDLACDDIVVDGFIEDLDAFLDGLRVSVAPLRSGAGIKGKIGTAMRAGVPVVGTSLAVEGMSLKDGEHVIVADSPDALAEAVARLYNDANLWSNLSLSARLFARREWGAEAACRRLAALLSDIAADQSRCAGERQASGLVLYDDIAHLAKTTAIGGEMTVGSSQ